MTELTSAEASLPSTKVGPNAVLLRLGLSALIVHFRYTGYVSTQLLDKYDIQILNKTCSTTARDAQVREELGTSTEVWKDLTEIFYAAARSFSDRCYAPQQPDAPIYNAASSARIVQNHHSLLKDVARIKDLVAIARNILVVGDVAQNLAAKTACDHAIFQVIILSVKVTARGFDQNGNPQDEEKWQAVTGDFKKLLVRCLEFLNNLTAQNERRKLMLWVELFDNSAEAVQQPAPLVPQEQGPTTAALSDEMTAFHETTTALQILNDVGHRLDAQASSPSGLDPTSVSDPNFDLANIAAQSQMRGINLSPYLVYIGRLGSQIGKDLIEQGKSADPAEIANECKRRWDALSPELKNEWSQYTADWLKSAYNTRAHNPQLDKVKAALETMHTPSGADPKIDQLRAELANMRVGSPLSRRPNIQAPLPFSSYGQPVPDPQGRATEGDAQYTPFSAALPEPSEATEEDYRVEVDANYGSEELERGKESLLSSLEADSQRSSRSRRRRSVYTASPIPESTPVQNQSRSPTAAASDIAETGSLEEEEEEESDEDDYPVPGDDGRGLLTDVPLILGPTEIEVLPMIIQSGIVPPLPGTPGYGKSHMDTLAVRNMHAVRCHLLLAQNNGQNLLRELLIFVAAWDLREDELYFKILVKIMDAILMNGLMPFSYHAFRESKDIISPAQAVIMKLLTNIFRARQSDKTRQANQAAAVSTDLQETDQQGSPVASAPPSYPTAYEARMVKFLFREFREHIIPQTCSLIFLQGKIRDGTVSPEDFPFNLWDMERMYEGIYQYLEFFAILTEHERWKGMMSRWEITSELVTLLEELDVAIPRSTPRRQEELLRRAQMEVGESVAVAAGEAVGQMSQHYQHQTEENGVYAEDEAQDHPVDAGYPTESEIASPPLQNDPTLPPITPYTSSAPAPSSNPPPNGPIEDEACDFEWRNLKKLAVLVLSSLVWKSPSVQAQLGRPDPKTNKPGRGIRALLGCCKVDDYNPYIKEHAIMALRFALEGSRGNMEIVRELQRVERERAESTGQESQENPYAAANEHMQRHGDEASYENEDVSDVVDEAQYNHLRQQEQQQQQQQQSTHHLSASARQAFAPPSKMPDAVAYEGIIKEAAMAGDIEAQQYLATAGAAAAAATSAAAVAALVGHVADTEGLLSDDLD